ncbi:unnamed protein product [Closterium sp. Naga37s-1]|nr:unnamed protein product [Closterium sp. Naga37s-1]
MRQLKPNWTLTFQRTSVKNPETIKPFPLTLPLPLSSRPSLPPLSFASCAAVKAQLDALLLPHVCQEPRDHQAIPTGPPHAHRQPLRWQCAFSCHATATAAARKLAQHGLCSLLSRRLFGMLHSFIISPSLLPSLSREPFDLFLCHPNSHGMPPSPSLPPLHPPPSSVVHFPPTRRQKQGGDNPPFQPSSPPLSSFPPSPPSQKQADDLANKQANDLANVEWWCGERGKHGNDFPHQKCPQGDQLIAKINFPVCWDGKNIDSADHRTHVVHIPLNTTCPSSHPVALPRISIKVYYPVSSDLDLTWPKDGVKGNPAVYLSTVQSGGTGSPYEYHSDFINGWDQKVLTRLVTDCINKNKKCLAQEDNV